MKKHLWLFLFAAPMLAIFMAGVSVYYSACIWKYEGPNVEFQVKRGETFSSINYRLAKNDIISNPKIFHRYSQFNKLLTKFRSGTYEIKTDSTMMDVIDTLIHGVPITTKVTIPEGKNIFEIGKLLEEKGIITSYQEFRKLALSPSFMRELKIPAKRVEGYLYPETYRFSAKTPAKEVIQTMVKEFFKQVKQNVDIDNAPFPLHSVVTLASIVEKETGAKAERPRIAGVFLNRLKKRMRLQSDPTTIYGIYENFNGNLRKRHLLEKTPYNTYKISGLPKGPISNPGLKSIQAVISPERHSYLYFVSQNDGTHIFSRTYREHLQAVNKFQKMRKNRVGKSWRDLKE